MSNDKKVTPLKAVPTVAPDSILQFIDGLRASAEERLPVSNESVAMFVSLSPDGGFTYAGRGGNRLELLGLLDIARAEILGELRPE